jgi:hypothetical protein
MKPIQYWLFPVIVVCLGIYVAYRNYPWWGDGEDQWFGWIMGAVVTGGAALVSILLATGVDSLVSGHVGWEWRKCWEAEMVSLRSADGVQGAVVGGVFILTGVVDSRQVYFYYTKNADGSFGPHRWTPDNLTRIYEEDRKDGQVIQWDKHFQSEWAYWFATPEESVAMDFHIPKGSIKQGYALQ